MLGLGKAFPDFKKKVFVSTEKGKEFVEVTAKDHQTENKWMVMFWYSRDFTFV